MQSLSCRSKGDFYVYYLQLICVFQVFSSKHELFQQLRKIIFKCLFLKVKVSFRCEDLLIFGWKADGRINSVKEEKTDLSRKGTCRKHSCRDSRKNRLQSHGGRCSLKGRHINLSEWTQWRKSQPIPVLSSCISMRSTGPYDPISWQGTWHVTDNKCLSNELLYDSGTIIFVT